MKKILLLLGLTASLKAFAFDVILEFHNNTNYSKKFTIQDNYQIKIINAYDGDKTRNWDSILILPHAAVMYVFEVSNFASSILMEEENSSIKFAMFGEEIWGDPTSKYLNDHYSDDYYKAKFLNDTSTSLRFGVTHREGMPDGESVWTLASNSENIRTTMYRETVGNFTNSSFRARIDISDSPVVVPSGSYIQTTNIISYENGKLVTSSILDGVNPMDGLANTKTFDYANLCQPYSTISSVNGNLVCDSPKSTSSIKNNTSKPTVPINQSTFRFW